MSQTRQVEAVTDPFWDGARIGRLLIPHCDACDRWQWPMRSRCLSCGASLGWKAAAGRGTLLTWSEVLRPPRPELKAIAPYTIVMVELEEGARMLARLAPPVLNLKLGLAVTCAFEAAQTDPESLRLPVFSVVEG